MDDLDQPREASRLPLQGPHRHPRHEAQLPPGFSPLRLLSQPSGMMVELTRADTLMGRHTDADVRLPLPDVSRRHCRFVFDEGYWHVIDLKSLNGVMVNGKLVLRSVLHHHDEVKIGGFTFLVDLETGAKAEQLPAPPSGNPTNVLRSIADALPILAPDFSQRKAA